MTTLTAENYHLKWDSHLSYLNLSVSTLFKNEKYADVMLLTSHVDGGHGIPAHRIILSSCSHFFASIFEANPSTPNSIMYIVLPPELSRRSIQILIQYMYCGEATVSNDILNEVLRGGEILKIRGLCRSNNGSNSNSHTNDSNHYSSNLSKNTEITSSQTHLLRSDVDKQLELRGLGASATAILKESPVIVRSPQPQKSNSSTNIPPITPSISVNKEVAIDPGEHYGSVSSQTSTMSKRSQSKNDNISRTLHHPFEDRLLSSDRLRRHSEDLIPATRDVCTDEIVNMSRRVSHDEDQIQRVDHRRTSLPETGRHVDETVKQKPMTDCQPDLNIPEALPFLSIKQEPTDWQSDHNTENLSLNKQPPPLDLIKSETNLSEDEQPDRDDDEIYSPLTCELCSEIFTLPADWVRHIESHIHSPAQFLPKKRKRLTGTDTEYLASLKCDMCTTFFGTPAEWVRHIQSTHTETELAISNKSVVPKPVKKKRELRGNSDYTMFLEKNCNVCNKKFPSYASMVIHKRTHTGEKPFICSHCNKGFNVKSNLFRHLRTLHNKFTNPTNIEANKLAKLTGNGLSIQMKEINSNEKTLEKDD